MSTHNICFYGELTKIILQFSSNTLLICSSEKVKSDSIKEEDQLKIMKEMCRKSHNHKS